MVTKPYDVKEVANSLLDEFIDALEKLNIPWWLFKGTCLGMVTVGGFYKDDYDIDIAIDCSDKTFVKLTEKLKSQGWRPGWTVGKDGFQEGIMGEHNKFYKHDIAFDIWSRKLLLPLSKKYGEFLNVKPEKFVYNGKEYNLPSPAEDFLVWHYGDWWKKK